MWDNAQHRLNYSLVEKIAVEKKQWVLLGCFEEWNKLKIQRLVHKTSKLLSPLKTKRLQLYSWAINGPSNCITV